MTEIVEKSYKTQIKLYDEILSHDRMIMHYIQNKAQEIQKEIEVKSRSAKSGVCEFTDKEINKLYYDLGTICSEDGFAKINSHIESNCIQPRKTKIEILNLLK